MKPLWRVIEILAWAGFFAFAAFTLALRFWLLPDIERYRGEIVAAVSRTVGLPVRIGGIEAGWQGLRPQVSFTDVRVLDQAGREALVLPRVENVLSWDSLAHRELRLRSLAIEAPRLTILRTREGDLYVAGLKLGADGGGGRLSAWVLAQEEIAVRAAEVEWRDELRGAPPLRLTHLDLRLSNDGDLHSLGLAARPPDGLASRLEVRAQIDGRGSQDLGRLTGRIFAQLGHADLAAWRPWLHYPLDLRQGEGALRLWLTLQNGEVQDGTADVALAAVAAQLGDGLAQLELASVQGRVRARRVASGYEVDGRGFTLASAEGPALPPLDFQAR